MTPPHLSVKRVLVTGATGYIGARLVPCLLEKGFRVRATGRSLRKLKSRSWSSHPDVELAVMNVFDDDNLDDALRGCYAAYYLIHGMNPENADFAEADREAASKFARAAAKQGLSRIIYLSGLGEDLPSLSKHLKSRREVESFLAETGVPLTVLRAAMVIGSGSASFEILRYLVDRLPLMVTPRWVDTPSQPIAVRDVLQYLSGCLIHTETAGKTFDVGGPEILTYKRLMEIYQEEAGLRKRLVIPVPVLTPRLSSYWIHLVTPVPASIARPLAEGLRNPVVCKDQTIREILTISPMTCREAIREALRNLKLDGVSSHWTDAGKIPPVAWSQPGDPQWAGGTMLEDKREVSVQAAPARVWPYIEKIGGLNGWYHADLLWKLRGFLDTMIGGVGLRRGRRNQDQLVPGDALDFWRVVDVRPPGFLLLAAEMKLPGQATLQFEVEASGEASSVIRQTARFQPRGLAGIFYWYLVAPFHNYVFDGMLKKIGKSIEKKIEEGDA